MVVRCREWVPIETSSDLSSTSTDLMEKSTL
jgi:hypothetical protein